jgi:hypothetical protein
LQCAWESAMEVVDKYGWEKIDCEKDWKMRSIEEINEDIMEKLENKEKYYTNWFSD